MEIRENQVTFKSGKVVTKYLLINDNDMEVEVLDLGATMTKIVVPDREGNFENVILEWQDLELYEQNPGSFGAVVGRVAGRIHDAKVTINDEVYTFAKNNNGNTLHGGIVGFDKKSWKGKTDIIDNEAVLVLSYLSPDGEEGFPGNLQVQVTYSLSNDNALTIKYEAETDKNTIVNLTNHAYFNLSGNAKRTILNHEVTIDSDKICKLDAELIPDGTFLNVAENKPFDFRVAKTIGQDIHANHKQLEYGNGYDHVWCLNKGEEAVKCEDPISGRWMTISTNASGVVMYTMNSADSNLILSNGEGAQLHDAVCFETQEKPIGYNEVFKEGVLLKKGSLYKKEATFNFGIK